MAEETKNIFIPADAVGSDETMKKVYINDVMYCIPVDTNIEVPKPVAEVIENWLKNLKTIKDERTARLNSLNNK